MNASPAVLTRREFWTLNVAIGAVIGLLSFGYRYLDYLARGHDIPFVEPLIEEMTGSYGVVVLLPFVIAAARRFRLEPGRWLPRLPVHLVAVLGFSAAHTTWNWATRSLLFPLFGLGGYDYGILPVRYAMELPNDVIIYALIVGFIHLLDRYHAARQRELHASRLEARLARAQLQNLRAQLQPHFLFNALNTVSSVMYEDVRRADAVLSRLAELLRRTMRTSGEQRVPLGEELEVLGMYLDVMRARFGDRLEVSLLVDDDARDALVPSLLLQPLVENAVRHGEPDPPRPARITLRAWRAAGAAATTPRTADAADDGGSPRGRAPGSERLVVELRDNGPGIAGDWRALLGEGIGLANTVERLAQLYGDDHRFEMGNAEGGGLEVRIEIPYAPAATAADPAPQQREAAWSA